MCKVCSLDKEITICLIKKREMCFQDSLDIENKVHKLKVKELKNDSPGTFWNILHSNTFLNEI